MTTTRYDHETLHHSACRRAGYSALTTPYLKKGSIPTNASMMAAAEYLPSEKREERLPGSKKNKSKKGSSKQLMGGRHHNIQYKMYQAVFRQKKKKTRKHSLRKNRKANKTIKQPKNGRTNKREKTRSSLAATATATAVAAAEIKKKHGGYRTVPCSFRRQGCP